MKSLRRRLVLWLLPATLLAGLLASAATYWGALYELDEVLSDQLKVIGRHVVVDEDNHVSLTGLQRSDDDRMSGEQSHGVLLQVWRGSTPIFSSDPDSSLPPPAGAGLADIMVGGQLWHSFVTREGDVLVRVAQLRKARWEAVAEIAMHLFWPVLSLIPLLALFLWFGIGYGLRPLREIAANLKRRDANNMQPIDTAAMPGEVKPLVDALNDLLLRLDHAFTAQKHFIADAAHELRTPIMGLGLQAELLERASSVAEREEITAQLRMGATRLSRLSEQLLTLARLAPDSQLAETCQFDLTALARSVVSERSKFAESNNVDLGLAEGKKLTVSGNAENLRILLNNLVDNAIRYGGAGSRVDVEVYGHEGRPVLEVRDTGPGIPEVDHTRVWERFYRGNGHAATGSGLGLSIVRRIAEQHHASITLAHGLEGRGLTVRVCFPVARIPHVCVAERSDEPRLRENS
ncbi:MULTISPECIES: ATP-binding protein [Caballeronia]|uniref:ATP-binding protein n=1 Tax=Caballeronia TaxID=1827195 RepID=UPI00025B9CF0|nr:ATP-binding protein [Caballeronia zhejiangensis]